MNIFITGASSILGSTLTEFFFQKGCTIFSFDQIPETEDAPSLISKITGDSPVDIVVLLQANDVLCSSLSSKKLTLTIEKLLQFNAAVFDYFSESTKKPKIILSTSSVDIYDKSDPSPVVETTPLSDSFPASFYRDVEASAAVAETRGVRVVHLRLGEVISKQCQPLLTKLPFLGLIPISFNDDQQSVSWISCEDAVRAVQFILDTPDFSGPVNITSGDTLKKKDFLKITCQYFHLQRSPALPPMVCRLLFGKEVTAVLSKGVRAVPFRLMEKGFFFEDIALQDYLNK